MTSKKESVSASHRFTGASQPFLRASTSFRALLIVVCFVVAFNFAFLFLGSGQPQLQVDASQIDFGSVPAAERVTKLITVSNVGNGPLQVFEVASTCGCTAAHVDRTLIQGGESANLSITVTGGGGALPRSVKVALRTNDPQQPVVTIHGRFVTVGETFINPSPVEFGRLKRNELPSSQFVHYHPAYRADDPPKPLVAATDVSFLRVTNVDAERKGAKHFKFLVELLADAPAGRINAEIKFRTAGANGVTQNHVRVLASVTGSVVAQPSMLIYGPIRPGQSIERRLITLHDAESVGHRIHVRSVETAGEVGELLRARLDDAGSSPTIEITYDGQVNWKTIRKQQLQGSILIAISTETEQETLAVPVTIFLEK